MKFFDIFCAGWIILLSCEPRQNNVPDHDTLQRWINPIDQMPFVWIRPGVINLTEAIGVEDSITINERQIFIDSGFWMGMTEITVG